MNRRHLALLLVAGVLAGLPATAPARGTDSPQAISAKSCSSGWKHAVIGGQHKCLRRGQFCARRHDSQYHRYGFHCHKLDNKGNYHLT